MVGSATHAALSLAKIPLVSSGTSSSWADKGATSDRKALASRVAVFGPGRDGSNDAPVELLIACTEEIVNVDAINAADSFSMRRTASDGICQGLNSPLNSARDVKLDSAWRYWSCFLLPSGVNM